MGFPSKSASAQPKSLISLRASFLLDEYRVVFAVNVTSRRRVWHAQRQARMREQPHRLVFLDETYVNLDFLLGWQWIDYVDLSI